MIFNIKIKSFEGGISLIILLSSSQDPSGVLSSIMFGICNKMPTSSSFLFSTFTLRCSNSFFISVTSDFMFFKSISLSFGENFLDKRFFFPEEFGSLLIT